MNPVEPFLQQQGALILDGGLATELEARGFNLDDPLWSARLLLEQPDAIRQVHLDYLYAGADCVISASYQATISGFMARGVSRAEAIRLIRLAVELALAARDDFWGVAANRNGRLRPLVAASVGPYGAYLADGSEYTGNYGLETAELIAWHRERWHILANSGADLLACETIPSYREAEALRYLLAETPDTWAWFSFSCRDGHHISDGTPITDCVRLLADAPRVAAIGVNCTPPRYIPALIKAIHQVTDKPIVVYPNSGEIYDPERHCWLGESVPAEFGTYSREWRKLGAALIGGCCRTGPAHIRQIADRMRRGGQRE
ncbi:MAG: homocysteine S-methyltransferase [Chloroflexi bacterium]|nr:MAG: homocysteine S-methyltransferase [Chloroflexota bacterium]